MTNAKRKLGPFTGSLVLGTACLATSAMADTTSGGVPPLDQERLLFSLDIGSDTEISDYLSVAADEELDPGDIYAGSSVVGSTTGAPVLDDATVFGFDPDPIQAVSATAVPVGTPAATYVDYFDLDGYDRLNLRLGQIGINGQVLEQPIPADSPALANLKCVARLRHLAVSFHDDDDSRGWRAPAAPRIPTDSAPANGTAANPTEFVYVDMAAASWLPALSETDVHTDLDPTPDLAAEDDDDVDAADYVFETGCRYEYFSADDEGRLVLNPAWIYEVAPGMAPQARITHPMLGVMNGTDVDAFEFAFVPLPAAYGGAAGQFAFALVYSVGANKPGSPVDPSGGLNPGSIYASFLDGASWEVLPQSAFGFGNIDAITVFAQPAPDADADGIPDQTDNCTLVPNPQQHDGDNDGLGNVCDADYNNDCTVNLPDLSLLRAGFFGHSPVLDIWGPDGEPDGVVNVSDLALFRSLFFTEPGPGASPNVCD